MRRTQINPFDLMSAVKVRLNCSLENDLAGDGFDRRLAVMRWLLVEHAEIFFQILLSNGILSVNVPYV